ncbi:hypothetical protein RHODO2019_10555 [Rhodococcus antarcticus]|uniref:Uncharacterized protein n=1 Tax=Rhodococcus antarcticus TaxID=2987751 RepID=A0ABY6NW91_9NOCA|nr:hypothetical protein [Rhodococcus antarcticus]UZJ23652.1 hypothetical protein RHODO2019_10555 [Rhodococcus antarcticus]
MVLLDTAGADPDPTGHRTGGVPQQDAAAEDDQPPARGGLDAERGLARLDEGARSFVPSIELNVTRFAPSSTTAMFIGCPMRSASAVHARTTASACSSEMSRAMW